MNVLETGDCGFNGAWGIRSLSGSRISALAIGGSVDNRILFDLLEHSPGLVKRQPANAEPQFKLPNAPRNEGFRRTLENIVIMRTGRRSSG